MIEFYELLGKDFIASDFDVNENEKNDLNIYINTLKNYRTSKIETRSEKTVLNLNSLKSKYQILKKTNQ